MTHKDRSEINERDTTAAAAGLTAIIPLNGGAGRAESDQVPPDVAAFPGIYIPDLSRPIPDIVATVTVSGVRCCSAGNFMGIIAPSGVGKSHLCAAIAAAYIAEVQGTECDTLGIGVHGVSRLSLLDAEQSPEDVEKSLRTICKRAGIGRMSDLPTGFLYRSYGGLVKEQRRAAFIDHVERFRPDVVILDGIGDFVEQNDESAVDLWLTQVTACARLHRVSIITTLQPNAGSASDKGRGHVGSYLHRLAESYLVLQRESGGADIRTLTAGGDMGKVRSGDRMEAEASFTWDAETAMFVSCGTPQRGGGDADLRPLFTSLYESRHGYRYSELVAAVMERTGRAERTAKARIGQAITAGIIRKDGAGITYILVSEPEPF